jgi:hypothetical protein
VWRLRQQKPASALTPVLMHVLGLPLLLVPCCSGRLRRELSASTQRIGCQHLMSSGSDWLGAQLLSFEVRRNESKMVCEWVLLVSPQDQTCSALWKAIMQQKGHEIHL